MNTNRNLGVTVKVLVGCALAALGVACSDGQDEARASTAQSLTTDGCTHAICATGVALAPSCDPCATSLCAADPYCCTTAWDTTCVGEVAAVCKQSCTAPPPPDAGPSTCAHPICATGAALTATCDTCATALCIQDPYCCATAWDTTCVGEVTSICGTSCK